MKYPNVTFIIPTLNASQTLEKCLNSIYSQKYPANKIEILVVDGGSTDNTRTIAKKYGCTILDNPYVFQEPGKTLAGQYARGEIFFYLDSDNILASKHWLSDVVIAYNAEPETAGFLPQTVPAPDSNSLDRYLGYLFTDPFTYFIYQQSANPLDYELVYKPFKKTRQYTLFIFPKNNFPLFGFAQGVGVVRKYAHGMFDGKDDMVSGIELMKRNGIVAYIPSAKVYHYHVSSFYKFIRKYTWRTRNNLSQTEKNIGLRNRTKYLSFHQRLRTALFIPYAFSLIFPTMSTLSLVYKFKDPVMFWHLPATITIAMIITKECILFFLRGKKHVGVYE